MVTFSGAIGGGPVVSHPVG